MLRIACLAAVIALSSAGAATGRGGEHYSPAAVLVWDGEHAALRAPQGHSEEIAIGRPLPPVDASRATRSGSPYGPFGGHIQCIAEALDGSVLYAATFGGGIFRSVDAGATWEPAWSGVLDVDVRTVAIDPFDPDIAYCGTFAAGLFRTTDGGATWAAATNGLGSFGFGPTIHLLEADPTTGDVYCCPLGRGLFRTTNHGDLWERVGEGTVLPMLLNDLAIDPASPQNLLAGDRSAGVYRSSDGGLSWSPVNQDFAGFSLFVQSLAFAPSQPSTAFCAFFAHNAGPSGGVWRSTDGGIRWSAANSGIPDYLNFGLHSVSVHPGVASIVYVSTLAHTSSGVFRSTNGGVSWTRQVAGLTNVDVNCVLCSPSAPQRILAGSTFFKGGVFVSEDGALSWTEANEGLTGHRIFELVRSGDDLFAAARGVIFRLRAGESRFEYCVEGLPAINSENTVYAAIAADPFQDGTLVAGSLLLVRDGVFKTTDSGDHWTVTGAGSPGFDTTKYDVAFDPLVQNRLFVGTFDGGVFRSTDGGGSFQQVNQGLNHHFVQVIGVDPLASNTLYAGTTGGGVYKSTNTGDSWGQRNAGIQDPAPEILDLAIDPEQPGTAYLTNLQNLATSLYKTTDGAGSWFSTVNDLPSAATTIALDPLDAQTATVVAGDLKLYRTTMGGLAWSLLAGDLYYTRAYPDPAAPHDLWVTALGCGAFPLGGASGAPEEVAPPARPVLAARPNPSAGSVRIDVRDPVRAPDGVSLRVVDLSGRTVRTLERLAGGAAGFEWNGLDDSGRPVASGVYHCFATGPGGLKGTRVVVIRR